MIIRKATKKDVKEIDTIYTKESIKEVKIQFPRKSKGILLKEFEKHKKSRQEGMIRGLNSPKECWLIAEEENKVIGFGQATIMNFRNDEGYAEIDKLYISEEFQRRGAGSKIEKKLEEWLKKKKVKFLGSRIFINNNKSINFHKKQGYEIKAVRMEKMLE